MTIMKIFELITKTILTNIPFINRMNFVYNILGVNKLGGVCLR